jgi:single-stranded-DNA-specific exonuclease
MLEPRHRWVFPDPIRLPAEFRAAADAHGLGPFAATVLARRGVFDTVALDAFLGPAIAGLHDPRLLPDARLLLERIERARRSGERIMVFGDFDADGLTGLAILVLTLRRLGLEVDPYVPSRLDEGHGLSMPAVEAAVAGGIGCIVTVDTGSSSVAEVAAARERGVDVVITDHHRLPEILPPAVALVNPHRADAEYPDRRLAGSGVAFTVARLLLGELAAAEADALELADLAAVGTVSDVAPILGENRAIVRLGLERIRTAPRPGIAALLERAGIAPAAADLETIGFVVAPRINAAGRVGEALDAARLLLAGTREEAETLAASLESSNSMRRELMRSAIAEARVLAGLDGTVTVDDVVQVAGAPEKAATPAPSAPATGRARPPGRPDVPAILVRGTWPVGIIGLVAGRLADETGLPAVVATEIGPVLRASCRSDGRMDLGAALSECADLFVRHGGHAAAAGFEIQADRWPVFAARFMEIAAAWRPDDPRPPLAVDLALPAGYVDYGLLRDLRRLAPCGTGNPEPLVAVLGLTVQRTRAATGGHTQLVLKRELDVLDGIAFGRPELAEALHPGDRVDIVARLMSRGFGGVESLQLEVRDVAPSGSHPRAAAVLAYANGRRPVGPGRPAVVPITAATSRPAVSSASDSPDKP